MHRLNQSKINRFISWKTEAPTKGASICGAGKKTADALTLKAELDNVRTQLTSVIAAFHDEDFQRVPPHPIFEELTVRQWLDFIGHHERRHIKQIKEVKQKLL